MDPRERGSGNSDKGKRAKGQKWETARSFVETRKRRYAVQRDNYTEVNTSGLKFNMANPKRFFPVSIRQMSANKSLLDEKLKHNYT